MPRRHRSGHGRKLVSPTSACATIALQYVAAAAVACGLAYGVRAMIPSDAPLYVLSVAEGPIAAYDSLGDCVRVFEYLAVPATCEPERTPAAGAPAGVGQ